MKILAAPAVCAVAVLFLCGQSLHAGTPQVAITAIPKKKTGEKVDNGPVTQEETLFQYTVTITNKSFASLSGLTAQYRVFVRDDSGKGAPSKQKLKRFEFSATIPDMPNNGKYEFDTEPIKLEKTLLDGNRFYVNGSRNRSEDKVAGVWIRIMQDDKIVGEYINPSTLDSKEKF